jgi:hypothetical protein
MKSVLIPGYKELFGEPLTSYEELLKDLSSNTAMMLLSSLNAELNTTESHDEVQNRLLRLITYRFSILQFSFVRDAFIRFKMKAPEYDGSLFARRYILSMFLKEVKRNHKVSDEIDDPNQEFNLFLAYLMSIDEVNSKDHQLLEKAKQNKVELMPTLPLIWAANINQYEFNERSNPAFEIFKLFSLCKYAYGKYKVYLKELVNKYGFKNIGQFISSFYQVAKGTLIDNPEESLRKLYFINPKQEVDVSHLNAQTINQFFGAEIKIDVIKKYPLYKTSKRGFMVIDEDIYKKKIYRGPLFELQKGTSLGECIRFEDYKNEISKECFEEILFTGIIKHFTKDEKVVHFDINSDNSEPDFYCRRGDDIFLIEFKDYLFPEAVVSSDDFKTFKKYIDERLVISDKLKGKGVTQLVNSISNIFHNRYGFDEEIKILPKGNAIAIHPIICYTDFMFGMPGINEYLNSVFRSMLIEQNLTYQGINNITLINIEVLYDLALRRKDLPFLLDLMKRYYLTVHLKRQKSIETLLGTDFIASTGSFDEMYQTVFRNEMIDYNLLSDKDSIRRMTGIIGITQEQLDEVL